MTHKIFLNTKKNTSKSEDTGTSEKNDLKSLWTKKWLDWIDLLWIAGLDKMKRTRLNEIGSEWIHSVEFIYIIEIIALQYRRILCVWNVWLWFLTFYRTNMDRKEFAVEREIVLTSSINRHPTHRTDPHHKIHHHGDSTAKPIFSTIHSLMMPITPPDPPWFN